jgi:hypothetical protein
MSLALIGSDRPLWDGDSTDDTNFSFQGWAPLKMQFISKTGCPFSVDTSFTGFKVADVDAAIAASITKYRPTAVLCRIGLNDGIAGTGQGPFQASLASYLNKTVGVGIKVYLVGPLCEGEKTDGSNTHDTAIDNVDGWMAQTAALPAYTSTGLLTFRSIRQAVFKKLGPALNVPPPGTSSGVFTRPDAAFDHQNSNGRDLITKVYLQDVLF